MLLDNKKSGKVGDVLRDSLAKDSKLSIISSQFSIHAYDVMQKELHKLQDVRLLLSRMALRGVSDDGLKTCAGLLLGNRFERRFRTRLTQQHVAKACMAWLEKNVAIKAAKNPDIVGQNLLHVQKVNSDIAIQGSSDFTTSGLGYCESDHYDMNTLLSDVESTTALREWFDTIWNDTHSVTDVKEQILNLLNRMADHHPPEFVYFLMLFHLFNDLLGNLNEESIIKTKTGFKDTQVWNKLYKFQQDGVLGAIDKIEKYNGCIVADSVGLGKTFEALAVIKYYELRNDRVLVLCPKILRENWSIFTINDKRNIFSADRFNFDVLNHTDLTRVKGLSGEINLEMLNWGNYDLVVIDESHNFRNNNPRKDGMTRYARLMNHIIKAGVKTKVLMLSATPVNNRMNDLKNQVAFITEGQDDAFFGLGIFSIEQSLKKAQTHQYQGRYRS